MQADQAVLYREHELQTRVTIDRIQGSLATGVRTTERRGAVRSWRDGAIRRSEATSAEAEPGVDVPCPPHLPGAYFFRAIEDLKEVLESLPDSFSALLGWSTASRSRVVSRGDESRSDSVALAFVYVRLAKRGIGAAHGSLGLWTAPDGASFIGHCRKLIQKLQRRLEAGPPAKIHLDSTMPVLFEPAQFGLLLHEAVGHALEGDTVAQGKSRLATLMGKQVANPLVNIVDDGLWPGRPGSDFDDEGNQTQVTALVRDGYLDGLLLDDFSAWQLGKESSGNGRRTGFEFDVVPRMTHLVMVPGTDGSLLDSFDSGVVVTAIVGGQAETESGRFSLLAEDGYLLTPGSAPRRLREFMISGQVEEVLQAVEAVGPDAGQQTVYCAKNGQGLFTTHESPSVLVSSLRVDS